MKGGKIEGVILLLVIAFTILVISIYVTSTKNKQSNDEQVFPSPTPTVLAIPQGSPAFRPVARPQGEKATTDRPSSEEIGEEIQKVFVNEEAIRWANFIAGCESTYNPRASNPSGYYGLFQYHPNTYKNCEGTDIWNWREQIMITKTCMFDHGRQNEFPACNRRYLKQ